MAGKPSGRYPHDRMQWASAWQAANNDWPALAEAYAREFGDVIHVDKLRLAVRYWERGQAEAGIAVAVPAAQSDPAAELHRLLLKGHVSTKAARESLSVSTSELEDLVAQVNQDYGLNVRIHAGKVELLKAIPVGGETRLEPDYLYTGKWHEFGVVSDNHLGSRYARLDALNAAYDTFEREGIKVVFNAGNMLDGYVKRINHFDLLPGLTGYTAQVEYLVEHYPHKPGITTNFITGDDHEGWWVKDIGANVGRYIQLEAEDAGREDLKWIGHVEADTIYPAPLGDTRIRTMHPGGGSSYAISYTPQKLIESFTGGDKPQILIIGHYHKADYINYRNVHCVQAGCTEDQTPFMRKLKLAAHIGFWICRFLQAPDGSIKRFQTEWFPFFDFEYYQQRDPKTQYKMW